VSITRVPGIRVGHWSDPVGMTGCTVVLCPPGTVGSGEVRGGAPGTRETDVLAPGRLVREVHAVLLTGGSAFGLAAADGVMRWLEEGSVGFDTGVARVPIVPAAVLFDLAVGDAGARPGPDQGYAACQASSDGPVPEGRVGAGTGATVAKLRGPHRAVPGGLGSAVRTVEGATVAALAAVNAYGEIIDGDGTPLAAALPGPEEESMPPWPAGTSTVISVVATDALLSKEEARDLAGAAHDGIAEAVRPAHTMWDGDTVFALATGGTEAPQPLLERLAEEVLAEAVRRAVRKPSGEGAS
jgi:L-aminopeptidase/D-esterase-like protein